MHLCRHTTTLVLFVALIGRSTSIQIKMSSDPTSPLNHFFQHDNQGMSIFDYASIGTTPDENPSPTKIDTTPDETANPKGKTTLQYNLEKILERQDIVQRYFTGRKVFNDCKTFPYCSHIPAPPPMLPPPNDLQAPNPNVWYPWQPRIKSQNEAALNQDGKSGSKTKNTDLGKKWEYDPAWITPYERPGVVPRLYNRQYQLHMYPNNIGSVVDNDASGPAGQTPPSGSYTDVPSEVVTPGTDSQPKNAGLRGTIPQYTTGYQPPNLANQAWDGEDVTKKTEEDDPAATAPK